jgi:hypothetical protein
MRSEDQSRKVGTRGTATAVLQVILLSVFTFSISVPFPYTFLSYSLLRSFPYLFIFCTSKNARLVYGVVVNRTTTTVGWC